LNQEGFSVAAGVGGIGGDPPPSKSIGGGVDVGAFTGAATGPQGPSTSSPSLDISHGNVGVPGSSLPPSLTIGGGVAVGETTGAGSVLQLVLESESLENMHGSSSSTLSSSSSDNGG